MASMNTSMLDAKIRYSVFNKHLKAVDDYILENLKNKEGSNFGIPVVQVLVERNPELARDLVNVYDAIFPEGADDIDYEIKILQASVLEGLVVGVNSDKCDYHIYTACIESIFGNEYAKKFTIDKTLELNRRGIIHAVRVDIDFVSESQFNYKVVSLNKNTHLHVYNADTGEGNFHLVPYIAIQRSIQLIKGFLDSNYILKMEQDKGEIRKVRYITSNSDVLAKYSDSEEFAKSLRASYYPLKSFLYAPVIGASSSTTGLTRIDLFNLERIEKLRLEELPPISKPIGGMEFNIKHSCMMTILYDLYNNDIETYRGVVNSLPNTEGVLTGLVFDVDKGVPNPLSVIKYTHSLDTDTLLKVYSMIPGLEEKYNNKKDLFNKYESVNIYSLTPERLQELLKTGIYKVQIQKKDCTYSTITITNSPEVLAHIYGKDYFARYESFGVRLSKLVYLLDRGTDCGVSLVHCGFSTSEEILGKVKELKNNGITGDELRNELYTLLNPKGKSTKKSVRKSTSNSNLTLARVCFASTLVPGSVDFYRYIDLEKVVSMYKIG